jgi:hypothetical protein
MNWRSTASSGLPLVITQHTAPPSTGPHRPSCRDIARMCIVTRHIVSRHNLVVNLGPRRPGARGRRAGSGALSRTDSEAWPLPLRDPPLPQRADGASHGVIPRQNQSAARAAGLARAGVGDGAGAGRAATACATTAWSSWSTGPRPSGWRNARRPQLTPRAVRVLLTGTAGRSGPASARCTATLSTAWTPSTRCDLARPARGRPGRRANRAERPPPCAMALRWDATKPAGRMQRRLSAGMPFMSCVGGRRGGKGVRRAG